MPDVSVSPLVGVWRLVSFETTLASGRVVRLFGPHPVGYLLYTPEGYMAVQISRPATGLSRWQRSSRRFLAYSGPYTVVGETVHHQAQLHSLASSVGQQLVRHYTFEGANLVLTGDAGRGATHRLVWAPAGPPQL